MKFLSGSTLLLVMHLGLCVPSHAQAATLPDQAAPLPSSTWQSAKAEHVYGFPEMKPNKKGTLTLSTEAVTFVSKAGTTSIDRNAVTAISAGNQRVELWGMKGRLLRMVIPDGGGAAAAMAMHHRIDLLTVEYRDKQGAIHGAVFFLPAHQADAALLSFTQMPAPIRSDAVVEKPERTELDDEPTCRDAMEPASVLVAAPDWEHADVPAAYRALVYEHVVDRLRRSPGAGHVYREGDNHGQKICAQYTIQISVDMFKQGSQVKRAILGPIGMFVGTTQMTFNTDLKDGSGSMDLHKQIKGTVRGEAESTSVADSVGKSIAKQYAAAVKEAGKKTAAQGGVKHDL